MTDAPNPSPAIAALLDEAAQLAAAANAKLADALAIAEQQKRVEIVNADRHWFKARPDRTFRARLATQIEIEDLHASGAWPLGYVADERCFVYAVVKKNEPPAGIEAFYFILPPPNREMREDELQAMWDRAAVEIARRTGQ